MITIDHHRCTHCGGCVNVCPVEALTLDATRLVVNSKCIDCGNCVAACPLGALHLATAFKGRQHPIKRHYDLVVVGAGPGGSTAAQVSAEAGLSVLLLEKRQEIGSPVRCAEGVGREPLISLIEPDPRWIAAEIDHAETTVISDSEARTMHARGGQGYVLERRIFDRVLAERAAKSGAEVRVKTAVNGLLMENGRVCGVRIQNGDFLSGAGEVEVEAQVIIAADGVEAQVGRWAGLDLQLSLKDMMVCAQYLLAGIDIDPTCTYYVIGHELAPGGYAWIFPKGEGKANVGLGVQADLWQRNYSHSQSSAPETVGDGTVLGYLTRFIEARPFLSQGSPVTLVTGNVPVAHPLISMVADGLMLVGDAARQVDPLTGGGIINAMIGGQLAAKVSIDAIAAGDTTAEFLSRYDEQWHRSIGRKIRRNYRLREKFAPAQRADERFMQAFALAVAG